MFSFGGLLIKTITWHPISLNSARNIVALVITLIYIKSIRHKIKINRYVLLAGACMAVTSMLFCTTNRLTTSANAILLQYTSPLFIILFSIIIFKIKPRKLDIAVCFAVFFGIFFFFIDSLSTGNYLGDSLALFSGITYSFVFMINMMPDGDAVSAFLVGELISFLVGIPFLIQETDFSAPTVFGAVAMGLIIGIGYVLIGVALQRGIASVTANLLGTVETVLNPVWVAVFYGEMLTMFSMIGFVIVVGSVVIYNLLLARYEKRG